MLFKKVALNIVCLSYPTTLSIFDCNNCLIKKQKIESNCTRICFYTKSKSVKLVARHKNQTVYKTIFLNCCRCQNIFVNFAFNEIVLQNYIISITLLDANYSFPVESAVLNFKK